MHYTEKLVKLQWTDLPDSVQIQAKRCLKDIIATAAGSLALPSSEKADILVSEQYGSGKVPLWFKGKKSTQVGAAFYNALTIDSLDCHDGYRPNKGHAGATVVPVVIGAGSGRNILGSELLLALVLGYEVSCRAGLAVHSVYSPSYHASGSWAALGAAASAARIMGFPKDSIDKIVGMAEYYAPMSPMLRCTENPSVVKDGAGAGAWAASMALGMGLCKMHGLPSLFENEKAGRDSIASFGDEWLILKQYFKPYPTCRWTQPVVEGAVLLQRENKFTYKDIKWIDVDTFDVGADLVKFPPIDSDGAQYCTPWAVAAMLVDGVLGVEQIHPEKFLNTEIIELGKRVRTHTVADIQKRFPEECLARVTITLKNGSKFTSPTVGARGDYTNPLNDKEMNLKFDTFVSETLGRQYCGSLNNVLNSLEERSADDLIKIL